MTWYNISITLNGKDLSEHDKEFIVKTIIRVIYELHDNGTILFSFSDEHGVILMKKSRKRKKKNGERKK